MLSLFIIVPIVVVVLAIRLVTRLLFGFNRGAGYGYRRGFGHRRHGFGGGLFTILSLVAFDRLFLGRRW